MAFAAAIDLHGDTKELLGRYEVAAQEIVAAGGQRGLLAHYCLETDDGIRVMNIYETEEEVHAAYDRPAFQQALKDAGFVASAPTIMPVHNYRQFR